MEKYLNWDDIPNELKPFVKTPYEYYEEMKKEFLNPNYKQFTESEFEEFTNNGGIEANLKMLEELKRNGYFGTKGHKPEVDGYEINYFKYRAIQQHLAKQLLSEHHEILERIAANPITSKNVTDEHLDNWEQKLKELQNNVNKNAGNPELLSKIEQNKKRVIEQRKLIQNSKHL